jgi:hypothetical protein
MLGSALYYPHIDIDDGQWLRSAVLYWDDIKTIVPTAVRKPYQNKDTNILWKEGFLEPLRCDTNSKVLSVLGERVVSLMDGEGVQNALSGEDPNAGVLMHAEKFGHAIDYEIRRKFTDSHIHFDKLPPELRSVAMQVALSGMHRSKMSPYLQEILNELEFASMHPGKMSPHLLHLMGRLGRFSDRDGDWLLVDSRFAAAYMSALAALLAKESDLAALTNEDLAMGVNLHVLLEDVKPLSEAKRIGALVSFMMETIKIDPETRIEKLLKFRRERENQLAELSAQFDDLSSKMNGCETDLELKKAAAKTYENKIRPKLEALKKELDDNAFQSIWEGVQRAVTVSVPAAGALAYFTGMTGTTLLAAGAAIAVTDVSVKAHLGRKKARRASPYTYLLDVESKFSSQHFA